MTEYGFEFKKKIVKEYLDGKGGMSYLSKPHGINTTGSCQIIQKWIHAYKESGDEGLLRSRRNDTYSFDFKLPVVELYLSTEVSCQELALSVEMNHPPLIR